jgi:hypothetical protein
MGLDGPNRIEFAGKIPVCAHAILRRGLGSASLVKLLTLGLFFVMAGPVPAIHVLLAALPKDVDARDKPGHDDEVMVGKQGATGMESRHHPRRRVIQ